MNKHELSSQSGVSYNSIYHICHGKRIPGENILFSICHVLHADIEELMRLRDIAITEAAKARPAMIEVICQKCGLPGNAGRKMKYPHEECQLEVRREGANSARLKKPKRTTETLPANQKHRQKKLCLKCNKKFKSEGPWNCVCGPCNAVNAFNGQPPRAYKIMETGKLAAC